METMGSKAEATVLYGVGKLEGSEGGARNQQGRGGKPGVGNFEGCDVGNVKE